MTSDLARTLSDRLADRFGDALRSVGHYDADGGEFVFVREDVDAEYDASDRTRVFRHLRLEALDRPNEESLFTHGRLEATVRCFERAIEFHVAVSETAGLVASVDAGEIGELRESVDCCLDVAAGGDGAVDRAGDDE
ncbi:hypothetical protein [Salinilacihabitans rarus]|uniref:hypothetical protein n=1 Tax=Salinilacihabitans rarus TaxID=2961596 RepID=UPI0020C8EA33|nr:hypothetical protein [Salinilacihabitans rarus]